MAWDEGTVSSDWDVEISAPAAVSVLAAGRILFELLRRNIYIDSMNSEVSADGLY